MRTVDRDRIVESLRRIGLTGGDGVLVHSALHVLGRPENGPSDYWEAFEEVLGPDGTLAVPTFTFAFCRGVPFDRDHSESEGMGVFSEYVRRLPEARRTSHPMQSLAIVGRLAPDLAARDTPSAFDPGSAFARMLELDFTMVLLGATIQASSLVHWIEQRSAVPYRYWKSFEGTVTEGGRARPASYRMFARDLAIDPQLDLAPIELALREAGEWREAPLGYGKVAAFPMQSFVRLGESLLSQDPWALVGKNRPSEPRHQHPVSE